MNLASFHFMYIETVSPGYNSRVRKLLGHAWLQLYMGWIDGRIRAESAHRTSGRATSGRTSSERERWHCWQRQRCIICRVLFASGNRLIHRHSSIVIIITTTIIKMATTAAATAICMLFYMCHGSVSASHTSVHRNFSARAPNVMRWRCRNNIEMVCFSARARLNTRISHFISTTTVPSREDTRRHRAMRSFVSS